MSAGPGAIALRPATPDDAAFLLQLYVALRAGEFAPLGLAPAQLRALLGLQHAAQERGWRARHPRAGDCIIELAGEPIGRMCVDRSKGAGVAGEAGDAIRLVDFSIVAAWRGAGIGARLIGALLDEAQVAGRTVRLSVAAGNPARRLYERLRFRALNAGDSMDPMYQEMEWIPMGD